MTRHVWIGREQRLATLAMGAKGATRATGAIGANGAKGAKGAIGAKGDFDLNIVRGYQRMARVKIRLW